MGVNSLFIYLWMNTVGGGIGEYADKLTGSYLPMIHVPAMATGLIACLLAFFIDWYICWFLYKRKIFIKI